MSDSAALLQQAVQLHQTGRLDEARAIYQQLLQADSKNPNALNLLGMVHHQQGRHTHGEEFIRHAIALAPAIAGFHNNLGNVLLAQRRIEAAEESYRAAVELQPDYAEAHNNLSVALLGQGKVEEAIAQSVKTVSLRHNYPAARNNLGNALRARYLFKEAAASYRDAIAQDPNYVEAHSNLAITLLAMGQAEEAIAETDRAIALKVDHTGAYVTRGMALERAGRKEEAVANYRAALKLRPGANGLRFQLAALTGEEKFATAPPEYVASLFDNYAETFDRHLTETLRYRGPALVMEALAAAGVKVAGEVVDLGCGTGLCGPLLRPGAKRLIGVDLSGRMIGQARLRKSYDELFVDDLVSFLTVRFAQFDVAIAADVMGYLGDLRPALGAVAQALKPGGSFVFTVERHDGDAYVLNATRRYAHSIAYIRSLLKDIRLREVAVREGVLRSEYLQDVQAWVVVLSRPA